MSENGKDPWGRERARERYRGPLLGNGTSRAQGDEGSRKDLAGDGRTHGTGIRRKPGEGSTESARSINTQFPAPHHLRGRDQSESRGGAHRSGRAWKVAGRLARCSVAPRCHHRDAGVPTRAQKGVRGCRKTPPVCFFMLLTIKELAEQLRIKPGTLYAWAAHGKIPCRKIHGLVRFDQHDIDRWLSSFAPTTFRSLQIGKRTADHSDLDRLIARAKRDVYTPAHGETITPSPTGKE